MVTNRHPMLYSADVLVCLLRQKFLPFLPKNLNTKIHSAYLVTLLLFPCQKIWTWKHKNKDAYGNTKYYQTTIPTAQYSFLLRYPGSSSAPLLNFLSCFSSAGGDVDEERLSGERFRERLMNVVNMFHIECTCGNRTWFYFRTCGNWTWIYISNTVLWKSDT